VKVSSFGCDASGAQISRARELLGLGCCFTPPVLKEQPKAFLGMARSDKSFQEIPKAAVEPETAMGIA